MANNLRYLLEHFCLDGQKIDISSQLDEENANNIEKINTQTVPSINARIDDIKNTDIPSINRRIDSIKNTDIPSINQKINTINNTTIPSVQRSVTAVDEKADRINESVAKNTRDIGTLSDNVGGNTDSINELTTKVNTNTDSINTINNTSIPHLQAEIDNLSSGGSGSVGEWTKIYDQTVNSHNAKITQYFNAKLKLAFITIQFSTADGKWLDKGSGYEWVIEQSTHHPLTTFSGVIVQVSGVGYICGNLNVYKDNRTNGTAIKAIPNRDMRGSNILSGCVLYVTD